MGIWRRLHKAYAHFFGYFWMPCPTCGEHFGGHEWGWENRVIVKDSNGRYSGVCNKCAIRIEAEKAHDTITDAERYRFAVEEGLINWDSMALWPRTTPPDRSKYDDPEEWLDEAIREKRSHERLARSSPIQSAHSA